MNPQGNQHFQELAIALDPKHPRHSVPPAVPGSSRVLDIGCGAGQILIARYPDRISFGIDIDFDALKLGSALTKSVRFSQARAEALPFPDRTFDLVVARVSLPYTDLRSSLAEIRRILRPGGLLWITLHPFTLLWRQVSGSNFKGKMFFAYIVLNSLLFHVAQRQFSFFGKYESFQTRHGIRVALARLGFIDVAVVQGRQFLVTARAR